ncbi:hypothetical protein CHUAL_008843 [Chamberlinius hualienensis]
MLHDSHYIARTAQKVANKMKLIFGSLMLLLCWSVVKANIINKGQSNENVMPSIYPKVEAENYSHVTSGAYIYNDCGNTTVGNLRNGGMLTFNNIDIGRDNARCIRVRYSNQATGSQTTIQLHDTHPILGGDPLTTVNAVRTNDWCDFIEVKNTNPIVGDFSGVQTLYLVFNTDNINSAGCDIDWFSFEGLINNAC